MFGAAIFKKIRDSQRGNVTMIFALAMIPIIGVAGFALDAQLAFSKKSKVQHAVDSAVLAGARLRQKSSNEVVVRRHARAYFDAILSNAGNGMTCDELEVRFVGDEDIEAEVTCYQPTTLTRIFGRERLQFTVYSTATYGIGKLDVAFVFDISGSMNSKGRLADLKLAAMDAVEMLLPEPGSSGDGDVRIAMASYNSMVDAGPYFEEVTGLKPRRTYTTEVTDTERSCSWECSKWHPTKGYCKDWDYDCDTVKKTRTESTTINSTCVFERGGDHKFSKVQPTQLRPGDLVDTLPSGAYNAASDAGNSDGYLTAAYAYWDDYRERWYTVGTHCLSVDPFELNDNKTQINRYIASLYASGGTAGHQGIEWAWYLISPEWSDVFDVKATPLPWDEPDSVKAMIIMTDGEFNSQFHSSQGNSKQQAEELCDEIKDSGVIVYTVAFDAPPAGQDILEYCASGIEFSFKASNGAQLLESYKAIASSISDLRIKT